ncbi:MAG: putative colanic acid biosynthesis acetyltransferase [Lewinellaceae bacterium]|nr:putative colanic acid biosynthesis acetyltransferase [Lewinellaceae bacterium]
MQNNLVKVDQYKNKFKGKIQFYRFFWTIIWTIFAKPLPRRLGNRWKLFLLRSFGADVHKKAVVYSSVRIYIPWNLEMKAYSCLGPEVDCYNVDKISIGEHSTISQKSFLCSASHDVTSKNMALIHAPIIIDDQVWIGSDSFISMGVTIGQGAVIGARSVVVKNVEPWTIVAGNPAKLIKIRDIK